MEVGKTIPGQEGVSPLAVPDLAAFRGWVVDCLAVLGVSAAAVSRGIGAGKNTVSQFLADADRGIDLGTAHRITVYLRGLSADRAVALPPARWAQGADL